jgi:hypothetical protein
MDAEAALQKAGRMKAEALKCTGGLAWSLRMLSYVTGL